MESIKKRQKTKHINPDQQLEAAAKSENKEERTEIRIKFQDTEGNELAEEIMIDTSANKGDLNKLID